MIMVMMIMMVMVMMLMMMVDCNGDEWDDDYDDDCDGDGDDDDVCIMFFFKWIHPLIPMACLLIVALKAQAQNTFALPPSTHELQLTYSLDGTALT